MVVELDGFRFQKSLKSATVNVYVDGMEVDVFTNYGINRSWNKFQKAAETYVNEQQ